MAAHSLSTIWPGPPHGGPSGAIARRPQVSGAVLVGALVVAMLGCQGVNYPHVQQVPLVSVDGAAPAAEPLLVAPEQPLYLPSPETIGVPPEMIGVAPEMIGAAPEMIAPPPLPPPPATVATSSAIRVPAMHHEQAWEQVVDVINDYFRVEYEQQVQYVGNSLTRGRIDTFPQIGATLLEPHRPDSVGRFNRWESTLQTIRRRAVVDVIPCGGAFEIQVAVDKELEDLPRPLLASAGAAVFRHDDALPSRRSEVVRRTQLASNWIPLGRDVALEQQILQDIQERFQAPPVARVVALPPAH